MAMQLKASLRAIIPRHLWSAAARLRESFSGWRYRRKLDRIIEWHEDSQLAVCYGDVLNDLAAGVVQGGRVKLLDLQTIFPEHCDRFNILYLVSSALPKHSYELVRWAKKRGAKFVLNQNGVSYPGWAGPDWEKHNAPNRKLLHEADLVVYQSSYCQSSADRYLGAAPCDSVVLYNAIDTQKFLPSKELLDQPLVLLATGSHQQPQRVMSVLEALHQLIANGQAVRFILAGRLNWPDAQMHVQEVIKNLGLSEYVDITGAYTREEAPGLYRRAHILVHTKYKDPCPTVVIEAMACGLPIIGSASGGMPELVGEQAGILLPVPETWDDIPVPEAGAIATAVREIESDLSHWQMQARARAVEKFDIQSWLEHHRELFSSLAGHAHQNGS
jgi:glycosyltransferase involved in cell wall biosynthesis